MEWAMKKLPFFLLVLVVFLAGGVFFAGDTARAASDPLVRVRLSSADPYIYFRVEDGTYELVDLNTSSVVASPQKGELWRIDKEGSGFKISVADTQLTKATGPLLLRQKTPGIFTFKSIQYRGELKFYQNAGGIYAVNIVPLEYYLYGVVGKEIGYFVHMEALKAQAIASRSYALANLKSSADYDLVADTGSQVYKGYSAELELGGNRVRQAVDETKGKVLYYGSELVAAYFHSNAGGYTENVENVWSSPKPYLIATPSPYDSYALNIRPDNYQWQVSFSRSELEAKVANLGLGSLKDLQVAYTGADGKPTASGRATSFTFVGQNGSKTFTKDGIRQPLGLRSTLFTMELDSLLYIRDSSSVNRVTSAAELKVVKGGGEISFLNNGSDNYTVEGRYETKQLPKVFTKVTFNGKGYGHGVGLSQWGAMGMAEDGYNYQDILKHYYGGKSPSLLKITDYQG